MNSHYSIVQRETGNYAMGRGETGIDGRLGCTGYIVSLPCAGGYGAVCVPGRGTGYRVDLRPEKLVEGVAQLFQPGVSPRSCSEFYLSFFIFIFVFFWIATYSCYTLHQRRQHYRVRGPAIRSGAQTAKKWIHSFPQRFSTI